MNYNESIHEGRKVLGQGSGPSRTIYYINTFLTYITNFDVLKQEEMKFSVLMIQLRDIITWTGVGGVAQW